jgi:hypothetical protein
MLAKEIVAAALPKVRLTAFKLQYKHTRIRLFHASALK